MTRLKPRETNLLLLAGILYAAVAITVGIRRGGDLDIHLGAVRLWLGGLPLYAGAPRVGSWWPPFAVLLVVPLALAAQFSAALAKGVWAAGSVGSLGWSLARVPRERWAPLVLALAAVAGPLHRNFEDLNMNALLLALLVAAALDLERGREGRAGAWIGAAAALKAFPALWLVYLAFRGRRRGLATGIAVAAGLTAAGLLAFGAGGAVDAARNWLLSGATPNWGVRGGNQSLAALAARLHVGALGLAALDAACVALAVVALRRPKVAPAAFEDLAVVTLLAVLVSPVAWVHYFLLALPAWVVALRLPRRGRTRAWSIALLAAGVATSGIATVWSLAARNALFELSVYTWGALLLLVVLAFAPREPAAAPAPVLAGG